jgi:hypothetical protein
MNASTPRDAHHCIHHRVPYSERQQVMLYAVCGMRYAIRGVVQMRSVGEIERQMGHRR